MTLGFKGNLFGIALEASLKRKSQSQRSLTV